MSTNAPQHADKDTPKSKSGDNKQKAAPRVVSSTAKERAANGRKAASTSTTKKTASTHGRPARKWRGWRGLSLGMKAAIVVGSALIVLSVIFFVSQAGSSPAGKYPFIVGKPGPGTQAPEIALPSTTGGTFDLAAMRGKTVLLYFQEGLTCQPCWDQLKDIQTNLKDFQGLGINQVVSITSDPLDSIKQKVSDEGITLPVLSDPDLKVSEAYTANQYGMMGGSRDGHTFIVVGPDGKIRWRADYGGAPNYTMYVPVSDLLADLRKGMSG